MLAFVTGRGRGIGKAVSEALEASGYRVVGPKGRDELDLTDPEAVYNYANMVLDMYGTPDLIVNNAGIEGIGLLQDVFPAEWNRVLDTNLSSAYLVIRAFLPRMISRGSGCIINIASMWGEVGASMESVYSASKGGMIALAKAMAIDLGPYGIRCNIVLPGTIKTERWKAMGDKQIVNGELTPIGDISDYEDIADAAWYFGSDASKNVTGAELVVDGGMSCQLYPVKLNEWKRIAKEK